MCPYYKASGTYGSSLFDRRVVQSATLLQWGLDLHLVALLIAPQRLDQLIRRLRRVEVDQH